MKKKIIFTMLSLLLLVMTGCSKEEDTIADELDKVLEEVKDKVSGAADATLEDDQRFIVSLDGVDYKFPMTFEEFKNYGWTPTFDNYTKIEDVANMELKPGDYGPLYDGGSVLYFKNKDIQEAAFFMINPDSENRGLVKDAIIYGIELEEDYNIGRDSTKYANDNIVLKLGKDKIVMNTATKDEVETFFDGLLTVNKGYLSPHLNMFFEYDTNNVWNKFSYNFNFKNVVEWYKK